MDETNRRPMFALAALGILASAYVLGMTGLPGAWLTTALGYLADQGVLQLDGPVGQAVNALVA